MFDKQKLNYMHDMMDELSEFVNAFYNPTVEEAYSYTNDLKELLEGNEDFNELHECPPLQADIKEGWAF